MGGAEATGRLNLAPEREAEISVIEVKPSLRALHEIQLAKPNDRRVVVAAEHKFALQGQHALRYDAQKIPQFLHTQRRFTLLQDPKPDPSQQHPQLAHLLR